MATRRTLHKGNSDFNVIDLQSLPKQRNLWPESWKYTMANIEVIDHIKDGFMVRTYVVTPRNPAWDAAMNLAIDKMIRYRETADETPEYFLDHPPPAPHLPPINFETVEELDAWAEILYRMK